MLRHNQKSKSCKQKNDSINQKYLLIKSHKKHFLLKMLNIYINNPGFLFISSKISPCI